MFWLSEMGLTLQNTQEDIFLNELTYTFNINAITLSREELLGDQQLFNGREISNI